MDNYKKALDKAVDYIMQELDYCAVCVNRAPCNKRFALYDKQGKEYEPDLNLCKDSVRQHFIRQAEAKND